MDNGLREQQRPRIYWLLFGPRETASSRLNGYAIDEFLSGRGWTSTVICSPLSTLRDTPIDPRLLEHSAAFRPGDIVIFQKLSGPRTIAAMKALKRRGLKIVFADCDYPAKISEARLADLVVCSSRRLGLKYSERGIAQVSMIPEAFELPQGPATRPARKKLTCVWFGSMDPSKADEVLRLRQLIKDHAPNWNLVVVSNAPNADYVWSIDTSLPIIAGCDAVVITGNTSEKSMCKSANRVTQAMALRVPVIAYPIPSYQDLVRHGRNGLLCESDEEWVASLTMLGSQSRREMIALTGYRYVRRYFNLETIGRRWEEVLLDLGKPQILSTETLSDRLLRAWGLSTINAHVSLRLAHEEFRTAKPALFAILFHIKRLVFFRSWRRANVARGSRGDDPE